MSFKLTILGSGSAVPTLDRAVSAQYLNFNERRILIDCGEGTQLQLRKYKIKFQRIQYIFISHLHGDHFQGIFGLLASMNLLGRVQKLKIFAPVELQQIVESQFKITHVRLNYEIEYITLDSKEKELILEDNMLKVYSLPLKHRIRCFGFLFEEKHRGYNLDPDKIEPYQLSIEEMQKLKRGEDIERSGKVIPNFELTLPPEVPRKYAYCSDTLFIPELADWIKDTDLLYHEATFIEKQADRAKKTMHSTASQAATIAKNANVKRLLLGHFSARFKKTNEVLEEAKKVFVDSICVEDGDNYIL